MLEGADAEVVEEHEEDDGGQSEPVAGEEVGETGREPGREWRGGQAGLTEDGGEYTVGQAASKES